MKSDPYSNECSRAVHYEFYLETIGYVYLVILPLGKA